MFKQGVLSSRHQYHRAKKYSLFKKSSLKCLSKFYFSNDIPKNNVNTKITKNYPNIPLGKVMIQK
eukprot:UN33238